MQMNQRNFRELVERVEALEQRVAELAGSTVADQPSESGDGEQSGETD